MDSVYVQHIRRADAADLIKANCDNLEHHAPWVSPFTDQAGFNLYYDQITLGPNKGFVARSLESDAVVGVFSISQISLGAFRSAYMGFYGMSAHSGRGLMTESLRHVVLLCFEEIGLHRIEANIQPANSKSINLVRRLGFEKEGYSRDYLFIDGAWRDHERWASLRK